jgi:2-oxoglutarate dehydrogenase E1 component
VIDRSSIVPENFHLHPKLQKWLKDRKEMIDQGKEIDWATGEHLAFGTLLFQGLHVRLAGQDTRRGTFSQRHEMWIDQESGSKYFPLDHLQERQGRFDVINSPLSEFAALAFEYGYTGSYPDALVLWEAQYGDFANGAQIVIDQYITTSEQKWNRTSSLTLLLPHGYEGQGPEHSSARIERFLILAGNNNIQVVNPTTPAQYFHLLRRQALRKLKKPLIAFTPKGVLRLPANVSDLKSFTSGSFQEILDDPAPAKANRILFCSGKIFYDLLAEREKRKASGVAIVRIEQVYPLHIEKLKELIGKYNSAAKVIWVQEEPENMGAWHFIRPHLMEILPSKMSLEYAGRERSASPATGSARRHKDEQQRVLERAFA